MYIYRFFLSQILKIILIFGFFYDCIQLLLYVHMQKLFPPQKETIIKQQLHTLSNNTLTNI